MPRKEGPADRNPPPTPSTSTPADEELGLDHYDPLWHDEDLDQSPPDEEWHGEIEPDQVEDEDGWEQRWTIARPDDSPDPFEGVKLSEIRADSPAPETATARPDRGGHQAVFDFAEWRKR